MNRFADLSVASSSADFAPNNRETATSLHHCLRTALLDEIALGLIVCDRQGQLQFVNPAAEQELASEHVLRRLGLPMR